MASQSQGIQQLLVAEKRAAEKVNEARKRKNRRLRQAKEEAQVEMEKYKSEREKQFREHEAKFVGSKGDVAARIEQDTRSKIEAMNVMVASNKINLETEIFNMVCDIQPEVHRNYKSI